MKRLKKYFDVGTLIVIIVTFILFVAALFTKGMTHDLLLEAGVFLVSVKLILMSYRNAVNAGAMQDKLDVIFAKLKCNEPETGE